MAKEYLILSPILWEGEYITNSNPSWCERARLRIAKKLMRSVPKRYKLRIATSTGTTSYTKVYGRRDA